MECARVFLWLKYSVGSLLLAAVLVLASAGTAIAATASSVTMLSESGDYIGQGVHRVFDERNADIRVSGNASYLTINVSGGNLGDYYSLDIAAPPGEQLHPGLYTGAQRAPFRSARRPGLDVSGSGRGCNKVGGRFDVKEILVDSGGGVRSLWMTYEQHCENGPAALFGEIRLAYPRPGNVERSMYEVTWPGSEVNRGGSVVPVWFTNVGVDDVTLGASTVTGLAQSDFTVRIDECNGTTLATGDFCQVWVRFFPTVAGPRIASLLVPDAGGSARRVALQGTGIGGRTEITMQSDPGDYIGGGQSYSYDPTNSSIVVGGSRSFISAGVDSAEGDWWDLRFDAPDNDILAPGAYPNATRYPFNGTGPGLSVTGNGRGCNQLTGSFTVTSIRFNPDETLRNFGATFEQHCEGGAPALRGEVAYRVPTGDTTPPARPSSLQVNRTGRKAVLSWVNPPAADYVATIARWVYGTTPPGDPTSGQLAYIGAGSSRTLGVAVARPISVAVFAIDSAGNVSRPAILTSPPPG